MKMRSRYTSINGEFVHECIGGVSRFVFMDSTGSITFCPDHEDFTTSVWPYRPGTEPQPHALGLQPPEPGRDCGRPVESRMQFDADMRLTRGIYQPIHLAQLDTPPLFSSSDLEDTEPWQ